MHFTTEPYQYNDRYEGNKTGFAISDACGPRSDRPAKHERRVLSLSPLEFNHVPHSLIFDVVYFRLRDRLSCRKNAPQLGRWTTHKRRATLPIDMKYSVNLEQGDSGEYVASCDGLGITVSGLSAGNALDAMREEIRYRIEFCPCTTVGEDYIELDVKTS